MTKRLSLAILLLSRIDSGDFQVCVASDGDSVELKIFWPAPMTNMVMLHKLWITKYAKNYKEYHSEFVGLRKPFYRFIFFPVNGVQYVSFTPLLLAV